MFGSFKDTAAKIAANRHPQVQRFGTVHRVHVDTERRTLHAEIGLKGETQPIEVTVRYDVLNVEGKACIQVREVGLSKEWLNEAAQIVLAQHGPVSYTLDGIVGQLAHFLL